MSNHLSGAISPYLLQHAENPVDWYPWGEEAFERARREDKPVFLSIGYSTCHWCHVMARESFEDERIAALLNARFIAVKVDREERPDVDSVYMAVCQAFTGSGGWPTSLFLTPERQPFFAGTYFPARSREGMIGFYELLQAIADGWERDRPRLLCAAEKLVAVLRRDEGGGDDPDPALLSAAVRQFGGMFDEKYGGFGDAPKFPSPHNLLFLLAYSRIKGDDGALRMAERTLFQMRRGGLFDHIGYGFCRYSTDRFFLAPHFEKMLYDNALLMLTYAAAYAAVRKPLYRDTAEKTAAYILREMTSPEGGFYSAQDADSGGMEGRYYLFGYDELLSVLGEETGRSFNAYYGITREGNFEGGNIPNRLHGNGEEGAFDRELPAVYDYRRKREKLHLDDKILTGWNGLMIAAFALLYRVTGSPSYLKAAQDAQRFVERELAQGDRLLVGCRDGRRSGSGFLDDYAYYAAGLVGLYEATREEAYLHRAQAICREAEAQFGDAAGGFFLSGRENEELILRPKETYDGALPSGNAMMAYNLVRLSQLTRDAAWEEKARRQLAFLSGRAADYPAGHSLFLLSLLVQENPPPFITVVLPQGADEEKVRRELPLYADVTLLREPAGGYRLLHDRITYYVCRGRTCLPPANTLEELPWK